MDRNPAAGLIVEAVATGLLDPQHLDFRTRQSWAKLRFAKQYILRQQRHESARHNLQLANTILANQLRTGTDTAEMLALIEKLHSKAIDRIWDYKEEIEADDPNVEHIPDARTDPEGLLKAYRARFGEPGSPEYEAIAEQGRRLLAEKYRK